MLECPLVPCRWNDATVLLCSRLPSTKDPNDGLAPTVFVVRQVEDQPLDTAPCGKKTTVLLGLCHHIEGREVFDPARIRGEHIIKNFDAQDVTPAPYHQLRRGNSEVIQEITNEVRQQEL